MMKTFFKNVACRVWFIVTAIVLALVIAINVVGGVYFYDVICLALSDRGTPILADDSGNKNAVAYTSDYTSKEDALEKSNALNVTFNEEGIVLMKNSKDSSGNYALPLSSGAKVSVFGKNSVNLVYGGSGSGGVTGDDVKTIYESLEAAGFSTNSALKEFYEDDSRSGSGRDSNPNIDDGATFGLKTGETPISSYTSSLSSTYSSYSDAALIVISRIGGEGFDLPRTMMDSDGNAVEGAGSATDHYLELDANEKALINYVTSQNFKHVVIIVNCNSAMELGFVEENDKIDGCVWIGSPGKTGIMALGEVLNGTVNPSGRTVDTYVTDLTQDPSYFNFSNNNVKDGNKYADELYYFVDYEEGIYVGYRYYETRGLTDGEDWYKSSVVYPFGYGLSYTSFSMSIKNKSDINNSALNTDGKVTLEVEVTNTGKVAGKQVVEIYATTPYKTGEIEKAHKVLCGFEKTDVIQPGKTVTVTIDVDVYSLASYDYNDANNNGFSGYELDAGDYVFWLSENAHTADDSVTLKLAANKQYTTDPTTGEAVTNQFDDADDELGSVLSRADWTGTWPSFRSSEEKVMSAATKAGLTSTDSGRPDSDVPDTTAKTAGDGTLKLSDLVGVDIDDDRWNQLLDQMTFQEMVDLFSQGAFQTIYLEDIGKPRTNDSDGPVGWTNFLDAETYSGTCSYASECVLGCTWNRDILYAMGESVGNEALVGDSNGIPYTTWYSPAVNIHRSAFGGRNFEYFSEDSFLSGQLAASEIKGCMSKGVNPTVKHFALNEQETNRSTNGLVTWATEQSIRELYLRPFEIAVKEGGARGIMSSFNRIGTKWAGGNYALLTTVLRKEWGFVGMVICDYNSGTPYMNRRQEAYAGGNLNLASDRTYYWNNAKSTDATEVAILRQNTKELLYAVANSNALNVEVKGYTLPVWYTCLIVADCVIAVGLAAWGAIVIVKAFKKKKEH
jgi:beta-glucosidase